MEMSRLTRDGTSRETEFSGANKDRASKIGRNSVVSKHHIQRSSMEMSRLTRDGTSRETEFSGANKDREIFIFLVQLTTSRIDNLTRLIVTLAICDLSYHTLPNRLARSNSQA